MRKLAQTDSFRRELGKLLKQHRDLTDTIEKVFTLLRNDIYSTSLHTHKLHGKMGDSYACSINYNYRIIFSFDDKYIYLESIGSHDEVY